MMCKYLKIIGHLIIVVFISAGCNSKGTEQFDISAWENNLIDRIGEAPVDGGFAMDGYWAVVL